MTDVKPSAAVEMALLTKERPLVSEMKAWIEENLTRLPPDQRALVMGVEPQGVYAFEKATVLPALVENAATGITAPMVAASKSRCGAFGTTRICACAAWSAARRSPCPWP